MTRILITILLFVCFKLTAQVGPPSLRCLEVLSNGDVKLSWIPPADPNNQFNSYEIFCSVSNLGPFNLVGTIPARLTSNFTHTGAGANVQSRFYYLFSKYGTGGANSSATSDTLRTLFLNLINAAGSPYVESIYNSLKSPNLPSTAPTFTLSKEYPATVWNILSISNKNNFKDTISVCSASLNYQVSISDASGCISTSNIRGGTFKDQKKPNELVIDSISVLPNGQTVIAWKVPYDKDVVLYKIYRNLSGITIPIDSVTGRPNTLYTYTNTVATTSAVELYSAAQDSCYNLGTFTQTPPYTTIFLKSNYDSCAYATQLNWNAYNRMPNGVLEYRVYYSINGGIYTLIGSTSATNFKHDNVAPSKNISYFVRAVNNNKTITSSSNRVYFFSKQITAPAFIYITKATVLDKMSTELNLFLDTSKKSVAVDILRSEDGFAYNTVGSVATGTIPLLKFIDTEITPKEKFYFYRAVVRDACGNQRTQSQLCKTILLKAQSDKEQIFAKHLSWNSYKGFNGGVSGYNIYRVINDVKNPNPQASTTSNDTSYTDDLQEEASNGAKVEYLIEAVEGISNQYGFLELSNSNTAEVYMEGRLFIPTAFAPSGKNKTWLPITHFIDKQEYKVTVYNKWGNKVFETTDDTKAWDGSNSKPDVYVYLISYKNSRGEYKEEKGTVLLLE